MPQSLSSILIHLVFSTKNCAPFIAPAIEAVTSVHGQDLPGLEIAIAGH